MRRWVVFNAVGMLGAIVQLVVLHELTSSGVHYLVATLLAVEAAILHNFAWHERWTWADRAAPRNRVLSRLAGFHAANGIVSLAGSIVLMRILVGSAGLPILPANLLSIVLCSLVNFFAADRLVFAAAHAPSRERQPGSAGFARLPRSQGAGFHRSVIL